MNDDPGARMLKKKIERYTNTSDEEKEKKHAKVRIIHIF